MLVKCMEICPGCSHCKVMVVFRSGRRLDESGSHPNRCRRFKWVSPGISNTEHTGGNESGARCSVESIYRFNILHPSSSDSRFTTTDQSFTSTCTQLKHMSKWLACTAATSSSMLSFSIHPYRATTVSNKLLINTVYINSCLKVSARMLGYFFLVETLLSFISVEVRGWHRCWRSL